MTISVFGPINSGLTTGGAGVSTSNFTTNKIAVGEVLAISVKYNGAPPAGTTDVIIKTVGTSPEMPSQTLLTLTDAATDFLFMPRVLPHDVAGTELAALTIAEPILIYGYINVLIQGANDADSVDVWLVLEQ